MKKDFLSGSPNNYSKQSWSKKFSKYEFYKGKESPYSKKITEKIENKPKKIKLTLLNDRSKMFSSNDKNCFSKSIAKKNLNISKLKYSQNKDISSKKKNTKLSECKLKNYTKSYDTNQINNLNFRKRKRISEKMQIPLNSQKKKMNLDLFKDESKHIHIFINFLDFLIY